MQSRPLSPPWSRTTKITVSVFVLLAFGIALYAFRIALVPLLIASITAYILYPPARALSRLTRMPHALATGVVYLALIGIAIPGVFALLPGIVNQASAIIDGMVVVIDSIQTLSPTASVSVFGFELNIQALLATATDPVVSALQNLAGGTIDLVLSAAQTVLLTVFTLIIGFYLTRDGERFVEGFISAIPDQYRADIAKLVHQIDHIWQAYFREQLFSAIVTAFFVGILASLVGLPQPALMGLLAGFLRYLPGIGAYIWLIIALILAVAFGSTRYEMSTVFFALIVVAINLAYAQGLNRILQSLLTSREVTLHPVVLIVGVLAGFALLGVLGVILAAPLVATVVAISRYIYAKMMNEKPFRSKSILMETNSDIQSAVLEYRKNAPGQSSLAEALVSESDSVDG